MRGGIVRVVVVCTGVVNVVCGVPVGQGVTGGQGVAEGHVGVDTVDGQTVAGSHEGHVGVEKGGQLGQP